MTERMSWFRCPVCQKPMCFADGHSEYRCDACGMTWKCVQDVADGPDHSDHGSVS